VAQGLNGDKLKTLEMIYLILSIVLFLLAISAYKKKKLNDFRSNLGPGDACVVISNGNIYDAEVEDVTSSFVYVVIIQEHGTSFNNRFHITEIYPPKK